MFVVWERIKLPEVPRWEGHLFIVLCSLNITLQVLHVALWTFLVTDQLISCDSLVRIQICWTLDIAQHCFKCTIKCGQKAKRIRETTSAELAWSADRWASEMHAFLPPSTHSLSTSKGTPLAPHPWLDHVSPPPISHDMEEAALGRPVVSVLVDNGSLLSCCGAVQRSAASLSTLYSTSFPALPWTLHVQDTFLLTKMLLSFDGRASWLNQQMGSVEIGKICKIQ